MQVDIRQRRRNHRTLRTACLRFRPLAFLHHPRVEPFLDQPQDAGVGHAMLHELDQPTFVEVIEEAPNVGIKNVVHLLLQERVRQRIQRLMLAAPRTKTVREAEKVLLVNLILRMVTTACWTILSSNAATPNGRCRPSSFSMYTLLEGVARYAPRCTRL